ncbi:uncharacterized protein BO97DRAFT_361136 [Aspergillus homomorphus CBS 101889]|uniref:mRNA cap guanine-N(7) methyltransferase n=1 Tax=Aspergillus homomorphus (strain CBS 101889) TaxID=1450537 RepID=A0A395I7Z5_ASPHC|nr:hypothetical protein BO97DRAFT_361136 [Aspergillus homomorphus CBS 101889]RAL16350.1 hypothetical protein BO97DRAFT_361136 [Aspergillus homomorphus CBS 101889]
MGDYSYSETVRSPSPSGHEASRENNDTYKRRLPEEEPTSTDQGYRPSSKRKRVEERHQKLRKRGRTPPSAYSRRDRDDNSAAPNRHAHNRSPSPPLPPRSPTPESQPRQRKRPGGGARMGLVDRETLRRRQEERERAEQEDAIRNSQIRGVTDLVRQHYNAVPQRGREWRKTESKIKGLRSFNNWVKSTLIQKFSPDEEFVSRAIGTKDWADETGPPPMEQRKLLVIDLGCGKGGDLGKWQLAPQPVDLYVGLDPAEISVVQARERYNQMRLGRGGPRGGRGGGRGPSFHAEFVPKDCFGEWLGDIDIVQRVGIDPNAGPGGSVMSSRWGGGGFDVVASMFAIHYAFESEEKARQMLRNVAGCLKKGGRFLGVCPNSDIISAKVAECNAKRKAREEAAASKKEEDNEPEDGEVEEDTKVEWGNSIYRVRFPGETPEDGVFRPPFGWRYNYFMQEAVEEVPEYVVPWEAFRALTEEYNLELQYRKPFLEVWHDEKDDAELGPLSERMGVRDRNTGQLSMTEEEQEAVSFYHAFCFYKREDHGRNSEKMPLLRRNNPQPSTPSSSATASNIPQPPPYNPPTIHNRNPTQLTLHPTSHAALLNLLNSAPLRNLKTHLQHAQEKLTDAAGEINERLTDAEERARRKRERNTAGGEEGENRGGEEAAEGEEEDLVALRESVRATTAKLDLKMRGAIDAEMRLEGLSGVLRGLEGDVNVVDGVRTGTRSTRSSRRNRRDGDGDEEMVDVEGEDQGNEDEGEEDEDDSGAVGPTLVGKIEESMAATKEQWSEMSLTQKYSTNPAYVGFYRIIHEAKHPGDDIPPLPHASTWFAHLEDNSSDTKPSTSANSARGAPASRTTTAASRSASSRHTEHPTAEEDDDEDVSDEDVAISRERISLKCPLTLLPFQDPVTSTKCPHSFEREAITAMIAQSRTTAPDPRQSSASGSAGRRARRVHCVQCPVCEVVLTEFDLRSDPVLLRRVKRAEAALRREQEELEDDEYDHSNVGGRRKRGRKSGITVASDDEDDDATTARGVATQEDQIRIKQERAVSVAASDVVDIEEDENESEEFEDSGHWQGGDDEDEEEEEEEEEQETR